MTDTERLDAIAKYGLCVVQHQHRILNDWEISWSVTYGINRSITADSIRQAIDAAVLDISTDEMVIN